MKVNFSVEIIYTQYNKVSSDVVYSKSIQKMPGKLKRGQHRQQTDEPFMQRGE